MTSEEDPQNVDELPDRFFNTTVRNTETGDFELLQRDRDKNEVLIMSPDGEEQWDEIQPADFTEDMYHTVPQPAIDDPAEFLTAILEGEENPLGVVGEFNQDVGRDYAMERTNIVNTE